MSAAPDGHSPVTVLIVDDNPAKRLGLKAALAPLGHAIVEADSGLEALRAVMVQDFAVILLDVRMPVMDGFETAAHIRQRRQSEMTPIIFITAHAKNEIVNPDLYAEGAVDFIFAPVPPAELRSKVTVFANLFLRAEALAEQAREVQRSVDHLKLLTDSAPIGIFRTDAENRYVYTNPLWSDITGVSATDAAGRKWDTIMDPEERSRLRAELPDDAADWSELCHRFEIQLADGASRILLVTSRAIPDAEGGWVGTLANITAEAGAEAAMAEARDRATEASQLKSDFLANMSHEIRTPMNGVIGLTDLLLETDLDPGQRDYAQTVRNSGEALLAIISDILDFSKIEAGKFELDIGEFDLQATVDDVVDLLAGSAQAKGLEVVTAIESTVPAVVSGDRGRLRQVLTNLIGNAIKFTEEGEVVLRVSEDGIADGATVVRFEISDTGIGIAPETQGVIFQPFVQADTSSSRKYGGTGLGLAISGQLVALMAGDCGVSSALGEGSTFWFTISVPAVVAQATEASLPDDCLSGVEVLVVDDNATQRSVLSEQLSGWGMVVATAESAEDALDAMRTAASEGRPHAVALVDRGMPGMDGRELRDTIVADPDLAAEVVLMTDLSQDRDLGACLSLTKPLHQERLRTCLRIALGATADVEPANGRAPNGAHADEPETGRLLLVEDNPVNQKVAVAILSSAGYRVDAVTSGAAAVRAVTEHSYDAVLMDCQMPGMNGYETTAAIRADETAGTSIPIIAVTAGARAEDRERCLDAGMDDYLVKPVTKEALLTVVAKSLRVPA